jgi:hypothetical protein
MSDHHTKRDGETLIALGLFLAVLGVPVILGIFWEPPGFVRWVSAVCGLLLMGSGGAFMAKGVSLLKRVRG